ncbi:hypothetical protein SLA2020_489520 [Shorea laevis]
MAMALAAQVREWIEFPPATQSKSLELIGKLDQESVSKLTILVMGKGGVGKSSTVNSIIGEKVVAVSTLRSGFTLNVIDTPGLVEGGCINTHALEIIKCFLLNKTIDVLPYVDRLDTYRVNNLDRLVVKAITDSFGKEIWNRALIVLSHAQLSPPDGLNYDIFFSKRSEAVLEVITQGAQLKKGDLQGVGIPIVLIENSGRCNKNEGDEKILPNGVAWIPNLVSTITEVVLNGSKAIHVNKKMVEGPNPNEKEKILIPLIALLPYLFIVKPMVRAAIKKDIENESRLSLVMRDSSAEWKDTAAESKSASSQQRKAGAAGRKK